MMIRIDTRALLLGVAVIATACSQAPAPPAAPETDAAPIDAVRNQFQTAYNAGDAAAVAALYADDAVMQPDHHAAVVGKAAITQYYQDAFSQAAMNISITPGQTERMGNMAHEHGTFTVTVTPKAGGNAMTDQGNYLVILEQGADGVWKLAHDIDNSDHPPAPAPAK
jgi:uncharacterized protein (TIGR02246 family)